MTLAEKRTALNNNQTAKMIWVVIMVLTLVGGLVSLLAVFGLSVAAGLLGGTAGSFAAAAGILLLALAVLIFSGIWRLERWVQWLMWLNVIVSLPGLLAGGRGFFGGLLPLLIAVGYTYVLRTVYPKKTTAATPPATPVA